jgi:hypothetical protein
MTKTIEKYDKMKVDKTDYGYAIVIQDGLASVMTTKKGAALFKDKKTMFYRSGCFEVVIPYPILQDILEEADKHISKYEKRYSND